MYSVASWSGDGGGGEGAWLVGWGGRGTGPQLTQWHLLVPGASWQVVPTHSGVSAGVLLNTAWQVQSAHSFWSQCWFGIPPLQTSPLNNADITHHKTWLFKWASVPQEQTQTDRHTHLEVSGLPAVSAATTHRLTTYCIPIFSDHKCDALGLVWPLFLLDQLLVWTLGWLWAYQRETIKPQTHIKQPLTHPTLHMHTHTNIHTYIHVRTYIVVPPSPTLRTQVYNWCMYMYRQYESYIQCVGIRLSVVCVGCSCNIFTRVCKYMDCNRVHIHDIP